VRQRTFYLTLNCASKSGIGSAHGRPGIPSLPRRQLETDNSHNQGPSIVYPNVKACYSMNNGLLLLNILQRVSAALQELTTMMFALSLLIYRVAGK
jgi:hypothetical protein